MKRLLILFLICASGYAQTIPSSVGVFSLSGSGGGGGGSGTVTSIPDGSTNGVTWTVATRTTVPTFTFSLGAITPTSIAMGADPADAGEIRLPNAGIIAWEASPAGTDVTQTVNTSEQFVFSNDILSPSLATSLLTSSTTFALLNTTATTVNAFGAATTLNIGNSAGTTNLLGILALNPAGTVAGVAWSSQGTAPAAPANSIGYYAPASVPTGYGIKWPSTITTGAVIRTGTSDPQTESIVAAGTSGNVLTSNGTTWTSAASTGTPAGSNTYIQYNNSGAFGAEAAFAYNPATNIATIGGITLGAGSEVSSIGPLVDSVDGTTPLNNINQVIASGTVYTLTTSFAAVDFGTTDPVITIANAGTYSIYVDVQTSLVSATTTTQSVSYKLRRTNNTAADLAGSQFGDPLPVATIGSPLGPSTHIGPIKYTTALTNDSITVQGAISGALGAGTATVTACTITAIRAY